MQPFTQHTGIVAALDRAEVDTDQMVPKQFLKRLERSGFGQFLFFDWRYLENGALNPEFELNRPEAAGATVLLARQNFGCGSSREHAVWALADYGFRTVLAPSFADIFYNNCFQNGILPVTLSARNIDRLFERAWEGRVFRLTIDLEECRVRDERGFQEPFAIDVSRRHRLLNGWDDIASTLLYEQRIAQYERAHP
jgi:3-isopropylmalate/(R)-2-methylmalate dehydratase small subunit